MNLMNTQASCTASSQTSFITSAAVDVSSKKKTSLFNITELCVKNNMLVSKESSDQEYETKIMKSLQDNLLDESLSQVSESDSLEQADTNMFDSNLDVQALAKDVIEKAKIMDKDLTTLEDAIHDALIMSRDFPTYSDGVMESESIESWVSARSDALANEPPDNETLNYVDCNKNVVDETVNVDSLCTPECHRLENTDEQVILMSDAIYGYLIRQCFEVSEHIFFPELLYDDNILKLYSVLESYYTDLCGNIVSDEDKNLLRLNITKRVMGKFEICEESPLSSNVSDKIFAISELVSNILDYFFVKYVDQDLSTTKCPSDSTDFSKFTKDVQDNRLVQQSTPQSDSSQRSGVETESPSSDDEIVISFKAKETKNLRNEKYWIAITKSPDSGKPVARKHEVINVDDIPLKPPPDLAQYNHSSVSSGALSPIPEEAVCNLFSNFTESDEDEDRGEVEEEEDVQIRNLLNNTYDTESTYISFECPETNAIVCNSVSFYRTNTVNSFSYTQPSTVTFVRDDVFPTSTKKVDDCSKLRNDSETSDDGNWMGYEAAKF
uniref:Uncharacterized protein n=1 Tax=Photinus pyralis TaxID=7054 RepID=A0A1Y1JZY2_PHOPY